MRCRFGISTYWILSQDPDTKQVCDEDEFQQTLEILPRTPSLLRYACLGMGPQKAVFQNPESAKMEISRSSPLENSTGQPHMQVSPRTGISTWPQVSLGARFPKQQVKQKCFSDRLSAKTGKKHFVGYHFSSKKKHIVYNFCSLQVASYFVPPLPSKKTLNPLRLPNPFKGKRTTQLQLVGKDACDLKTLKR